MAPEGQVHVALLLIPQLGISNMDTAHLVPVLALGAIFNMLGRVGGNCFLNGEMAFVKQDVH